MSSRTFHIPHSTYAGCRELEEEARTVREASTENMRIQLEDVWKNKFWRGLFRKYEQDQVIVKSPFRGDLRCVKLSKKEFTDAAAVDKVVHAEYAKSMAEKLQRLRDLYKDIPRPT